MSRFPLPERSHRRRPSATSKPDPVGLTRCVKPDGSDRLSWVARALNNLLAMDSDACDYGCLRTALTIWTCAVSSPPLVSYFKTPFAGARYFLPERHC